MAEKPRKFWEVVADAEQSRMLFAWIAAVMGAVVVAQAIFIMRIAIRPKPVVVVPGATAVGIYQAGAMPQQVIVDFARNFVVDLSNFTSATVEAGLSSAARYMSPGLLAQFEPTAAANVKQVVQNRVSQFFSIQSYAMKGQGPFVIRFVGEKRAFVGKTLTESGPYYYEVEINKVESTDQNPYGLLVTAVSQGPYGDSARSPSSLGPVGPVSSGR